MVLALLALNQAPPPPKPVIMATGAEMPRGSRISDSVQGPIPLPTSCGMWAWQLTGQQPKSLQGRGPRPAPDSRLKTQETIKGTA